MNCIKCGQDIPYGANYCPACGEKISKEQTEDAYHHTFWGKINSLEDWYNKLLLKKITGHIAFKCLTLILVLGIGAWSAYEKGTQFKIMQSEAYSVEYNKEQNEYYIYTDMDEINLNLYIPKRTDKIRLCGYSKDEEIIKSEEYLPKDYEDKESITVQKDAYAHMSVETISGEEIKESIKFFVLDKNI